MRSDSRSRRGADKLAEQTSAAKVESTTPKQNQFIPVAISGGLTISLSAPSGGGDRRGPSAQVVAKSKIKLFCYM
jgi:hypothetical protein